MLHKLRAARDFSLADWILFLRAWTLMLFIDLWLRLLPFRQVWDWVSRQPNNVPQPSQSPAELIINNTSKVVNVARRNHIYPMTCLRSALTLHHLLIQQGISTELHFGAQKENNSLIAHAWLEYQGNKLGEPEMINQRYLPLLHNSISK